MSGSWFSDEAGSAVLESEAQAVMQALGARPGLPWLVFATLPRPAYVNLPHGLWLHPHGARWRGGLECGMALPLASESVGAVLLQHVEPADVRGWLAECARVMVPGACLTVFALNPLSPYRMRWQGEGVGAREPFTWRRRLRQAGLEPEPLAQGIGPTWQCSSDSRPRNGAGARAAWMLAATKRRIALTPRPASTLVPALGEGSCAR
ncbi:hypothetical protein [Luteimonas sp. e5]